MHIRNDIWTEEEEWAIGQRLHCLGERFRAWEKNNWEPLLIIHKRRKKGINRGVRRIISDSRASPLGKLVEVWEWHRVTYRAIIPAQVNIQKMTNPALPNLAIS